jgi:hypothetical protein
MMGKKSLDLLTDGKAPYDYILGCHSGGAKNLIGNKGYVPYLRVAKDAVQIDEGKGLLKSRFDDKYVLRANTDHPAAEVAKSYKNIWRVDRAFREAKSTIQVRPVFHHRVDTTMTSAKIRPCKRTAGRVGFARISKWRHIRLSRRPGLGRHLRWPM